MTKQAQNLPEGKIKISINVPARLLNELDSHRAEVNQDRSVWITSAIMEKMASINKEKQKKEI